MLAILICQRKAIKVLPLSERGKVLNKERKKKSMLRLLRSGVKINLQSLKLGRRKKTRKLVLLVNFKLQMLGPQQVISA